MEITNIDALRQDKFINDFAKNLETNIISETLKNISLEIISLYLYVDAEKEDKGNGFFRDRIENLVKLKPDELIVLDKLLGLACDCLKAYQGAIGLICNDTDFTEEVKQMADAEIDMITDDDTIYQNSIVSQMQNYVIEQLKSIRDEQKDIKMNVPLRDIPF